MKPGWITINVYQFGTNEKGKYMSNQKGFLKEEENSHGQLGEVILWDDLTCVLF